MSRRGAVVIGLGVLATIATVVLIVRHAHRSIEDAAGQPSAPPTTSSVRVDDPGCPARDTDDRPFRVARETGPIAPPSPDGGRVCAYDRGRLADGHRLSVTEAVGLARVANGAPEGIGPEGLGCPGGYDYMEGWAEPHWTARLHVPSGASTDLWVYGNVCNQADITNDDGRVLRLTPALTDLLSTYVPASRHFPAADPAVPPGPVPGGRMAAAECPGGIVSGVPDWFGGEPVAVDPSRRAIRMSGALMRRYPKALLRFAGQTATTEEQSWMLPDRRRVGWFLFERVAPGRWSLREVQLCSPPRDRQLPDKPRGG